MSATKKDKERKHWCLTAVQDVRCRGVHYPEGEHVHVYDQETRAALLACGAFMEEE